MDPTALGAEVDEQRDDPPFLRFAPDAQELFDSWRHELENVKLRAEGQGPLIESHLAKYRSLMPSLALLFHVIELVDGLASGPVTLGSARRAVDWCNLLEAHARRAFQSSFEGDLDPARRLADAVRGGVALKAPFTPRE